MTIEFRCPRCSQVCAFREAHAGRRARCLKCGQHFIVPSESGQKPQKVKLAERPEGPFGGFYRAVWKLPRDLNTLTGVLFLLVLAVLFFLLRQANFDIPVYMQATGKTVHILVPFGLAVSALLWGMVFHYNMEILQYAAFDLDSFPPMVIGGGVFSFIVLCLRGLYIVTVCVLVALLPVAAVWLPMKALGVEPLWLYWLAAAPGLFLLPVILAAVGLSGDLMNALRPDLYLRTIRQTLRPYLYTCLFVIPCAVLLYFMYPKGLIPKIGPAVNALYLLGQIAAVLYSAFTARVLGLFCRHYNCYML